MSIPARAEHRTRRKTARAVSEKFVPISGSEPVTRPGATRIAIANPRRKLRFTVVVRSRAASPLSALTGLHAGSAGRRPEFLTAEQFQRQFGPSREDLKAVERFGRSCGLNALEVSAERSCVVFSGTVSAIRRAFQSVFSEYEEDGVRYISHEGPLMVPSLLAPIIHGVLGLDGHTSFQHHAIISCHTAECVHVFDIAALYGFPDTQGKGACIALIQLAGGYNQSDLDKFFSEYKLDMSRIPTIGVAGQKNDPVEVGVLADYVESIGLAFGEPLLKGAVRPQRKFSAQRIRDIWLTIEATVDIQLLRALAPNARIVVYIAPNDSHGIHEAFMRALTSKDFPPTVISCSWGIVEASLKEHDVELVNRALQQAVHQGVTVCCSSGDFGDELAHYGERTVHFPASSPYALGCGGTHIEIHGPRFTETVWTDTVLNLKLSSGGGISRFAIPHRDWQSGADVRKKTRSKRPGRGVPDVAAKAGLKHGYRVVLGGREASIGGTSVSSPLWAALIACLNEKIGRPIGWLTPRLYMSGFKGATHPVLSGSNGLLYKAGPGWNPCCGLGSPNGARLLQALGRETRAAAV